MKTLLSDLKNKMNSYIIQKRNVLFWTFGLFAFLWVLVRTGANPKRLAYPCQQAALPLASAWFISIIAILKGVVALKHLMKVSFFSSLIVLVAISFLSFVKKSPEAEVGELPVWKVANPVSVIAVVDDVPPTSGSLAAGNASVPDSYLSDPAMEKLAGLLGDIGVPLYKAGVSSNGLIGASDVVIIKANLQWPGRQGTNTDRIKGLIWLLLNHPDNFTGEIIVCDNTQVFTDISHRNNNSDDTDQSIIDVVNTFNAKGYPVFLKAWKDFRTIEVSEYNTGNYTDGYVYNDNTKTSYPKFKTPSGDYHVSLRYGIWDSESSAYDSERLSIINFPVLKRHSMAGATIALKNWVGVLTTADDAARYGSWNDMHYRYFWGEHAVVAKVMAITYPKLNIVDATWTNSSVKTNKLVASTDPVAASWYTAKYILGPATDYPNSADPDDPGSTYGTIIRHWGDYLAGPAGFPCTMDSARISVYNNKNAITEMTVSNLNSAEEMEFSIYPNPNNGVFIINSDNSTGLMTEIKIVNAKGGVVYRGVVEEPVHHINIQDAEDGVYYLKLGDTTKKIIKTQM